jgi:hypothetical protein
VSFDNNIPEEKIADLSNLQFILCEENTKKVTMANVKVKYYKPIINRPDYQTRIYRRTSEIEWTGKVHEKIIGYNTASIIPANEEYSLYHHKKIERQKKQNEFYSNM